jgi:hypothetical protein
MAKIRLRLDVNVPLFVALRRWLDAAEGSIHDRQQILNQRC